MARNLVALSGGLSQGGAAVFATRPGDDAGDAEVACCMICGCPGGPCASPRGGSPGRRGGGSSGLRHHREMKLPHPTRLLAAFAGLCLAAAGAMAQPRPEVVVQGLADPWSLAFLPDGRMLLTERGGNLRIAGRDGRLSAPLAGLPIKVADGKLQVAGEFEGKLGAPKAA